MLLSSANGKQVLAATAVLAAGEVGNVGVAREGLGNLSASLNLTNLNETVTRLRHSLANGIGTLGLTLGTNNVSLALLLSTLDNEAGTLGILLGNLLLFDGLGELATECHVGDGDIFEGNVELGSAAGKVALDALRDSLTLGDELSSVELGHNSLEDFVADGGEDTLIVVDAEVLQFELA